MRRISALMLLAVLSGVLMLSSCFPAWRPGEGTTAGGSGDIFSPEIALEPDKTDFPSYEDALRVQPGMTLTEAEAFVGKPQMVFGSGLTYVAYRLDGYWMDARVTPGSGQWMICGTQIYSLKAVPEAIIAAEAPDDVSGWVGKNMTDLERWAAFSASLQGGEYDPASHAELKIGDLQLSGDYYGQEYANFSNRPSFLYSGEESAFALRPDGALARYQPHSFPNLGKAKTETEILRLATAFLGEFADPSDYRVTMKQVSSQEYEVSIQKYLGEVPTLDAARLVLREDGVIRIYEGDLLGTVPSDTVLPEFPEAELKAAALERVKKLWKSAATVYGEPEIGIFMGAGNAPTVMSTVWIEVSRKDGTASEKHGYRLVFETKQVRDQEVWRSEEYRPTT